MDANRTYLLAQNGMPGEYIVSHPFIARTPLSQNNTKTMQRRESIDSVDSIACEKEEAQTTSPSRSGLRSAFSKVAQRLSGAGKEKQLNAGQVAEAEGSNHEPFQVKGNDEKMKKLSPADVEKERVEMRKGESRDVHRTMG